MSDASHEFLEHTSELLLRVRATSWGALLEEAGRALGQQLLRSPVRRASGSWYELEVHSSDRAALLVDWLNELLYRAEVDRRIATEIDIELAGDVSLRARARGVNVAEAPVRVKAATLHGLEVRETAAGLEAEVIFDV